MHSLSAPLCTLCIGGLTALFLWSVWIAFKDGVHRLRRLHQIPCDRCAFHTGSHLLKCTVYPCKAFTEDAIDCLDFEPATSHIPPCSNPCKPVHSIRS